MDSLNWNTEEQTQWKNIYGIGQYIERNYLDCRTKGNREGKIRS